MSTTAYDQGHFQDNYPPGMRFFYWTRARNVLLHQVLLRQQVPMPMLEVGCGTGIVVRHLRAQDLEVTGVELGKPTVDPEIRTHVLTGQDALTLPADQRQRFRSIGVFDVIEHIEDAPAFLRALLNAFPQVEQVVVTVPAGPELWSNYDVHFGHFRRYTDASLREHLSAAGLRTTFLRSWFPSLYWAQRAALRIGAGKKRQVSFDPPVEQPRRAIHAAMALALRTESALLPGSWRGSSLVAVGTRQTINP